MLGPGAQQRPPRIGKTKACLLCKRTVRGETPRAARSPHRCTDPCVRRRTCLIQRIDNLTREVSAWDARYGHKWQDAQHACGVGLDVDIGDPREPRLRDALFFGREKGMVSMESIENGVMEGTSWEIRTMAHPVDARGLYTDECLAR